MTTIEKHQYKTLDAMRGVAAIAVVLYHFNPFFSGKFLFQSGYLAVDLFFVLSGFVITHAYSPRFTSGLSITRFIVERFLRFWPMTFLGCLLGLVQLIFAAAPSDAGLDTQAKLFGAGLNSLLLPSFFGANDRMFPANAPEWSLFYEIMINIAFGLSVIRLKNRALSIVLIVSGLYLLLIDHRYHGLNVGWARDQLPLGLARVTFSFGIGMMLKRTEHRWREAIPYIASHWLLAVLALLMFIPSSGAFRTAYDAVFVIVLSPVLVMLASKPKPKHAWLAGWLAAISYPIYAIHHPALKAMQAYATSGYHHARLLALIVIGGLLVVGAPLGKAYDEPVRRRLKTRLLRSPRQLKTARSSL